jgi:three-Cys-motif partner protein
MEENLMSWEMKAHTRAKHVILNNYLKAWFPIMALSFPRILYIDGFAGPGRYKKGEDGSPIMALKIANDIYIKHESKLKNKEFVFIFIELDKRSVESLKDEISTLSLPKNFKIFVENNKFADLMGTILDHMEKNNKDLAPSFAFIDPFGTKGMPFEIVKKIMSYRSCEVFINLMYFGVIRSEHATDHSELFGTDEWKKFTDLQSDEKHTALTTLYADQLRNEANVRYVRSFNIKNKNNATLFDLIYGTNNLLGLEKMKEAMWKADPLGNFSFRDRTKPNQLVLFESEADFTMLKSDLLKTFKGKTVDISEIETHVLVNTPYLKSHIRSKALTPLEKDNKIFVTRPGRHGFPKGTKIQFL